MSADGGVISWWVKVWLIPSSFLNLDWFIQLKLQPVYEILAFSAFSGVSGVAPLVQMLDRIFIELFSVQMKHKQEFYEIYSHQALV